MSTEYDRTAPQVPNARVRQEHRVTHELQRSLGKLEGTVTTGFADGERRFRALELHLDTVHTQLHDVSADVRALTTEVRLALGQAERRRMLLGGIAVGLLAVMLCAHIARMYGLIGVFG